MTVIATRTIEIQLKVEGQSMAAVDEAFDQAELLAQLITRRCWFVVQKRGSYTERVHVIEGEILDAGGDIL